MHGREKGSKMSKLIIMRIIPIFAFCFLCIFGQTSCSRWQDEKVETSSEAQLVINLKNIDSDTISVKFSSDKSCSLDKRALLPSRILHFQVPGGGYHSSIRPMWQPFSPTDLIRLNAGEAYEIFVKWRDVKPNMDGPFLVIAEYNTILFNNKSGLIPLSENYVTKSVASNFINVE